MTAIWSCFHQAMILAQRQSCNKPADLSSFWSVAFYDSTIKSHGIFLISIDTQTAAIAGISVGCQPHFVVRFKVINIR